jgi:hypothetical protein
MRNRNSRTTTLSRRLGRAPRKSGAAFSYAIADRLDYLNTEDWDALAEGQSFLLSRRYQEVLRAEGPGGMGTRYGLIYDGNQAVAIVAAHLLAMPAAPSLSDDAWLASRKEARPQQFLICGDFFVAGFHGIAVHPDYSLGTLWPAITEFLARVQRQESFLPERDCVLIKDIPSALAFDTPSLRACQFHRLNTSPAMLLTMPERWTGYDDYLAHLNVRHRMGAYRVARDLSRAGIEARRITNLGSWTHRIHAMYLAVQRKGMSNLAALPSEFLPALTHRLEKDSFRCTGLFKGEDLVAFVFSLRDRDTAICYSLGWDRKPCADIPVLPALLHAVIEDALSMGCHRIDYGRTALKAKAQIGAHPQAAEMWAHQTGANGLQGMDVAVEPLAHSPIPDPAVSFSL